MNELYCPECGKKHDANKQFCENCGKDLKEVILEYKQKNLPIQYSSSDSKNQREKIGPKKVGFSRFDSRSRKGTIHPVKYFLIRTGELFLNIVLFFVSICFEVMCSCTNED